MLACVQRVSRAEVVVEDDNGERTTTGSIETGFCVLLGIVKGDTEVQANWMARKIAHLRVFNDDDGRFNRSLDEVNGAILLISQFTLAGDCARGNRPSFINAAPPEVAQPLYELVAVMLRNDHNLRVETGRFQTTMSVSLVNEGPVTILVQTPEATGNDIAD